MHTVQGQLRARQNTSNIVSSSSILAISNSVFTKKINDATNGTLQIRQQRRFSAALYIILLPSKEEQKLKAYNSELRHLVSAFVASATQLMRTVSQQKRRKLMRMSFAVDKGHTTNAVFRDGA